MKISILSDTHDALPDALPGLLADSDLILHAGDLTHPALLARLEEIAPVIAVRGNCDTGVLATLPTRITITRGSETILMIHNLNQLQESAIPEETTLIICGHTHVPVLTRHHNRRYLNPGSPVAPRGGSDPSFAILDTAGTPATITFVRL